MSLGTVRPYTKTDKPTPVALDKFILDHITLGVQSIYWSDLLVALQAQLGNNMTVEAAADAAARNALTVTGGQVGKRLVRLADTGIYYLANAAGTGAGFWTEWLTVPAASTSVPGVIEIAESADAETDTTRALTIAEFLRRLGPYRTTLDPKQALWCTGIAASATQTLASALGTADASFEFAFDVPPANPATNQAIWQLATARVEGTANELAAILSTTGNLQIFKRATSTNYLIAEVAVVSTYGGTRLHVVGTRSGTTLLVKLNGVTTTMAAVTSGTPPTWADTWDGTLVTIGQQGVSYSFSGAIVPPRFFNRCLTPAQAVTLYRTGAIEGRDRNTASNTNLLTGANSDFSAAGSWTVSGATTISGGKLNLSVGDYALNTLVPLTGGKPIRFTITIDSHTGTAGLYWYDGAAYQLLTSADGNQTFEVTPAADYPQLQIRTLDGNMVLDTALAYNIGVLADPDLRNYAGGPQIGDGGGNNCPINLPGDGVTGGVTPLLPGATPSPFTVTRASSGYLIADQVVIPPGCRVRVFAEGDGTFSLGDSAGTPASIVNGQTAPATAAPITQAGYVTATRKLYLTLGTATSVALRIEFFKTTSS